MRNCGNIGTGKDMAISLEGMRVEEDGDNVDHMWEQVKRAMVEVQEKVVSQ